MKHSNVARTLAVALAVVALGIAPAAKAADKGCSNASLEGTFAFSSTGYIIAAPIPPIIGPYAEVGTQTFDGRGGVTFASNVSQNGNASSGPATGSYTVNPDCTGTFTQGTPMFTAHFSFVLEDSTNGFRAICLDPGTAITRIGRRQFPVGDWRNEGFAAE